MPVAHLNQVELARRWKVSARTLERWRYQGVGPCYLKLRGRVAYRLEDIEAFEKSQLRPCGAVGRTPIRPRSGAHLLVSTRHQAA